MTILKELKTLLPSQKQPRRVLTIHFHQKLVEGLLLLCVGEARHGGGALLAHGVNLINVDDAGGPGAGLLEEAPHTGSAKA